MLYIVSIHLQVQLEYTQKGDGVWLGVEVSLQKGSIGRSRPRERQSIALLNNKKLN